MPKTDDDAIKVQKHLIASHALAGLIFLLPLYLMARVHVS